MFFNYLKEKKVKLLFIFSVLHIIFVSRVMILKKIMTNIIIANNFIELNKYKTL